MGPLPLVEFVHAPLRIFNQGQLVQPVRLIVRHVAQPRQLIAAFALLLTTSILRLVNVNLHVRLAIIFLEMRVRSVALHVRRALGLVLRVAPAVLLASTRWKVPPLPV